MLEIQNDILVVENFISLDEIERIKIDVFNLRPYWKNMLEYPGLYSETKHFTKENLLLAINSLKDNFECENVTEEQICTFLEIKYNIQKVSPEIIKNILKPVLHVDELSDNLLDKLCNDIKSKIWEKDICQNMLGDATYLLRRKRHLIDWEVQKVVRSKFNWFHKKLILSLENVFKENILISKKLPCPGFHIFGPCECNRLEFVYHKDLSIHSYNSKIDPNTIYSYVTLIQSPNEKPFLDYILDYNFKKQYYEYTKLYIWKGTIDHRIGTFLLNKNEYRVTFQGHLFYDPNHENIKLFF